VPPLNNYPGYLYSPFEGTGIVIISPTRELALQIFGVVTELMARHSQTFGIVMGGANRRAEADKLVKGVNLIVATPGRLLDHLEVSSSIMRLFGTSHRVPEYKRICFPKSQSVGDRRGRPDIGDRVRRRNEKDHQYPSKWFVRGHI